MHKYWIEVVYRAATESFEAIGQTTGVILFGFLTIGFGLAFAWHRKGPDAMKIDLRSFLDALPSLALAWMVVFLWHLVRVPYLINAEVRLTAQKFEQRTNEAENRIQELEGRLSESGSDTVRDAEIARLRAQLDESAKRKKIREALGNLKVVGERLRERCRSDPPGSTLEREAEEWFAAVQKYLGENLDSSYVSQFASSKVTLFSPNGVPEARQPLWHGLNQRAEVLDRFIDQLR